MIKGTEILAEGFLFPEGPRWHENKLWFSDMHDCWVRTVDLDGKIGPVVEVPNSPSGLGWLPDGRLLVVSMIDRRLLRLEPAGLTEVADLSRLASSHCNDMVVDQSGRAYIGNFGFDLSAGSSLSPAEIVLVEPDGQARIVAKDMLFPNGSVITPDGRTFIVAETFGCRLTAFDIASDGGLFNRRLWAPLEGVHPDGICLDAEGAIWVAAPTPGLVLRVKEGGTITDRVEGSTKPYACMLGGPDRGILFVCTSGPSISKGGRIQSGGRIEIVQVEVPGAGIP
jgi:sugar lactone lactonase YvrE